MRANKSVKCLSPAQGWLVVTVEPAAIIVEEPFHLINPAPNPAKNKLIVKLRVYFYTKMAMGVNNSEHYIPKLIKGSLHLLIYYKFLAKIYKMVSAKDDINFRSTRGKCVNNL